MQLRHSVFLHASLSFSGITERLLASTRVLEDQGSRVTVLSTPGSRERPLREAGLEIRLGELPLVPTESPFAFLRTRKQARALEPTVLHATDESLAALAATLARHLQVPYVLEVHHQVRERLPQAEAWLSAVVATSESFVEGIVNHGRVPRAKVRMVRHAPRPVPVEGPGPLEREGRPRIASAGYLDRFHNTEWLLEAARRLIRSGRRYSFAILGEGPREMALRRAIREANLAEHVTLAVPTTAETARTLSAVDVFVSCRGGGGPSWISCQAMAQGLPCIFAATGEAFHLVRDRRSGVLTEPGNGRRLAEEIELMVDNPDFARAMGARAREHLLAISPAERFERATAELHAVAEGTAVASGRPLGGGL